MNRSYFTWAGLSLVLMAAAVLSFAALRDLELAVDIPVNLAWLLPIAVDAGAAVSCAAWLSTTSSPEVARFARSLTWSLLGLTVVANAASQGMTAAEIVPPWWAAVAVGAIPPAVLGAVVHLAVLAGRQGDTGRPVTAVETSAESPEGDGLDRGVDNTSVQAPLPDWKKSLPSPGADRAAELIAAGVGRRRLARELAIPEHAARVLLAARRNGHGPVES